ncbi:MoxR-like ATPase [Selenomonas sp. GACV-9]|uniref:AAA family ATPase n=1 Tax=Selenomonas sp. GACV-9 TaxID=3158782 RepID=UPI0008F2E925|nr:MoxR-like ATPase [Selenomonas ruminantium]
MREFWQQQGLRETLLTAVDRFRQQYPWQGQRPLAAPRYHYYGREIIEAAVTAMLAGENLLLTGPKATGKNVLAENLAAAFGRPDWNVSFHINMDAAYLIGTDTFRQGAVEFRPGPVYACAESGGFGVLDEINMARNEALAVLHSLLDFRRILDVPGYGRLRIHPAARFIATMNHGYAGTRELNEALASRFVILQLPVLDGDGVERLLAAEFPRLMTPGRRQFAALFLDLQQKCEHAQISSKAVDLRGLLDALRLIELGLSVRQALAMGLVNKCFDAEERELVEDTIALRIAGSMTAAELFD